MPGHDLRNWADAYRLLLAGGLIPPSEVISWADRHIAASDVPSAALIDLSLSDPAAHGTMVSALGAIPGASSIGVVSGIVFAFMRRALTADPSCLRQVTRALEQMARDGIAPSEGAIVQMGRLDDALALAESSTWGTVPEVEAEVLIFLGEHAALDAV